MIPDPRATSPHRHGRKIPRKSSVARLSEHPFPAPGGHLALTAFAAGPDGTGSELSDAELYRARSLEGGLAFTPDGLRRIFADLTEVELRRMREQPDDSELFGVPFLWTALFRRDAAR